MPGPTVNPRRTAVPGTLVALSTVALSPLTGQEGQAPDNTRHPPGIETVPLGEPGQMERRGPGPVDLLLLDILMLGMSGFDVLRVLEPAEFDDRAGSTGFRSRPPAHPQTPIGASPLIF